MRFPIRSAPVFRERVKTQDEIDAERAEEARKRIEEAERQAELQRQWEEEQKQDERRAQEELDRVAKRFSGLSDNVKEKVLGSIEKAMVDEFFQELNYSTNDIERHPSFDHDHRYKLLYDTLVKEHVDGSVRKHLLDDTEE